MLSRKSSPDSVAAERYGMPALGAGSRFSLGFLRVNRVLNRPLAALLVRALVPTKVTPNQVTWSAFVVGLAGAVAFYRGSRSGFIVGGILAELSSIIDCADGMLARARKETSEFGASLDLVLDRVLEFLLMTAGVLGYYAYSGRVLFLTLGLSAAALYFLEVVIYYLVEEYAGSAVKSGSAENRGFFLFLIFLSGVTGRIDIGIGVLLVLMAGMNLFLIVRFLRLPRR